MTVFRQTFPLLSLCRKTLRPTLSPSASQRCRRSGGLGRVLYREAHECGNNKDSSSVQFAEASAAPSALPVFDSLAFECNTDEYVRLVEEQIRLSASWDNAAFLFDLLQALRLALACLSSQRNSELELLVSFLDGLESKTVFFASERSGVVKRIQQLPRKIVKLPEHFFIRDPEGKLPTVQIFPELPFFVSPVMASTMRERMSNDNWKDFIAYFLQEIYGDDLIYVTAAGWKNTQGIHPVLLKGLVDFASRKNSSISESDVKVYINAIIGKKKDCYIKAYKRKIAAEYASAVKTGPHTQCNVNSTVNIDKWSSPEALHKIEASKEVSSSDPLKTSAGAEYVQLVEQEMRQHASEENAAFMDNILKNLRTALATHRNVDLELLVSFLDSLVSRTDHFSKEKETFKSCRQLSQKIVELPNHYFVNEQIEKIPKVQIFPHIPFYISPALASLMEERKKNWKGFVQKFLENIYGDDLVYLTALGRGGKQGIDPLILKGFVDLAVKEDSTVSQRDVINRINSVTSDKRITFKRKIYFNQGGIYK